jgi:N-acetylneuraminate synthase
VTSAARVFIIAEAGINHNGSLESALRLVESAAAAGADAVKFQTFQADKLVSSAAPKADYQVRATGGAESQLEMLRRLELAPEAHRELHRRCLDFGIEFMSTPFDEESLEFLVREVNVRRIKIGSGDLTNAPLLVRAARTGRPLLLSTGMSTLEEVRQALEAIAFGMTNRDGTPKVSAMKQAFADAAAQAMLREKTTLLHCTTEYPAPCDEINLHAMHTLRREFGLAVGLSDHSAGIAVSIAAAALGAAVIEKHFTLDRRLPGPDHNASLEPEDLRAMVRGVREIELALGDGRKAPTASERKNLSIARRSLVAARDIHAGEKFNAENLAIKRPGTGISPRFYWDWLGRTAEREYRKDEVITQ